MKITEFIPIGQKNAITQDELSIRCGLPKREIRKQVHNARINGASGYYIPESAVEAVPYIRMQQNRIRSAKAAVKSTKRFIKGEPKK
ncbi:MAG: hypothetical protein NC485_09095 [Ruminococcus flavefaciens]|nr:hypothetical protein [Ruminococcus flavefaciens]MCM1062244.1 hypothetical protein [Eubacterium sp.]